MTGEAGSLTSLDICLCTHNPDQPLLRTALHSILSQTADHCRFSVLLVDSASTPPLRRDILNDLMACGISCRLIRLEKPGLARARARAIRETGRDLILFVDDDNELSPSYVEQALSIADSDPEIGCFGGKLLLPDHVNPPSRITSYVRFLAVRDDGDVAVTRRSADWGIWEPSGAGAVVRRELAELFADRFEADARVARLGRTGTARLSCGEDNLMMRAAAQLGLKSSYQPTLVLTHHVDPSRFKIAYLLRLLFWFGRSEIVLSRILQTEPYKPWRQRHWARACGALIQAGMSPVNVLCSAAINLGKWVELRQSDSAADVQARAPRAFRGKAT